MVLHNQAIRRLTVSISSPVRLQCEKGIWITDNPVVSSAKLNPSSPKTILVFLSTVTTKHHCFEMWWQPTLWVVSLPSAYPQPTECNRNCNAQNKLYKLDTEWGKLCCMFSYLRNTVTGIVKRGDSFRKQREEQSSSAPHGNLEVRAEDSFVLHSTHHGEPRASCSLRKIKISVLSFLSTAQSAVISYSPQLECFYSDW